MSVKTSTCPKCATPLPSDAPRGMCPECLLLGGFEDGDAAKSSSSPGTPRERTIHIVVPLDEPGGAVPETLRYFGDYELLEQIAVGGMGVVFKARQVSLNRLVAVKMIRAGQLAREDDIRRFRTEAEAAANLKHPHIVAIHEVGEHEGRHFFSMDYIEGRSLAALVRDHPLEPERAARLVQTVAEAIAYAHGRGVLHRDLKPSNVMIDAQDQPHVTDFGLAKLFASPTDSLITDSPITSPTDRSRSSVISEPVISNRSPDLTLTGQILGSPSYMSPEQARGRGDQVSVRSDVYALGAMLYELLTARPPFLAASALETMKLVAEREPVAPRILNPSAPRDLETICLKCLQKEPAHRYATADALTADLARWQRHEPIHARPTTVWEHGAKWARRHPARAGLVALSVATPALIIALLLFNERRVARQRDRALTNEIFAVNEARRADHARADSAIRASSRRLLRRSICAASSGAICGSDVRAINSTRSTAIPTAFTPWPFRATASGWPPAITRARSYSGTPPPADPSPRSSHPPHPPKSYASPFRRTVRPSPPLTKWARSKSGTSPRAKRFGPTRARIRVSCRVLARWPDAGLL